jgi:type II secretory pathway component PulF
MPLYRYDAFDKAGKTVRGTVESSSMEGVQDILRKKGLFLTSVILADSPEVGFSFQSLFEKSVDAKTKILFTKQLAVLLRSGVPLLDGIGLLIEQFEGRMRRILIDIKDRLKGGESLASGLSAYPTIFPKVYIQLVKAGEASGKLELILERLVDYLQTEEERRKRIKKAMSYPIMLLSFSTIIVTGLLTFVVPTIAGTFSETGKDLPLPTQILLGISEFLTNYYPFILAFLALLTFLFLTWRKSQSGRARIDKLKISMPLFSYITRTGVVVRFSKTLSMLLDSGVNLAEALDIVVNIIDNTVFTRILKKARDKIVKEGKIAQYLKETNIFPSIASYMISTGEQSGKLADMLLNVGKEYEVELAERTDALVATINPILMFFMGGIIFFIIISIMLPMVQMGETLGF